LQHFPASNSSEFKVESIDLQSKFNPKESSDLISNKSLVGQKAIYSVTTTTISSNKSSLADEDEDAKTVVAKQETESGESI